MVKKICVGFAECCGLCIEVVSDFALPLSRKQPTAVPSYSDAVFSRKIPRLSGASHLAMVVGDLRGVKKYVMKFCVGFAECCGLRIVVVSDFALPLSRKQPTAVLSYSDAVFSRKIPRLSGASHIAIQVGDLRGVKKYVMKLCVGFAECCGLRIVVVSDFALPLSRKQPTAIRRGVFAKNLSTFRRFALSRANR